MPAYRSRTTTHGRNMAGARALWRATGMKDGDFGKPIVAVVNSFTQFVPGHVHLKDLGQLVAREIEAAGGVAKEFNTIAVDDGIAMGHSGMLYSLPSRELIADSVEYMVNAHCADAMVCISNCDKITPGMLMASMRLDVPTIFVSGGPMEAGKIPGVNGAKIRADLITAMVAGADERVSDAESDEQERSACPTCGSCSGMFTANSMNCLTEALGLALPGNGSLLATHADRRKLFVEAGWLIVDLARRWYEQDDPTARPRGIATFEAFENAMSLDIAMGGSTNTVLHLLAAAQEGGVPFTMSDIDRLSRRVPNLCKVAPSKADVHMEDVHRAGGIMRILGELDRAGLIHAGLPTVHAATLGEGIARWDIRADGRLAEDGAETLFRAAPGNVRTVEAFSQERRYEELDADPVAGVIRDVEHAFSRDGGLAVLSGNIALEGAIVKTAGVDPGALVFAGPARIFESQDAAVAGILGNTIKGGRRRGDPLRRTQGRPRHAGNALPDVLPEVAGGSERSAPSSPTAASRAAPPACRSVTSRRKPPRAGPSGSSRKVTGSRSISPTGSCAWPSPTRCSRCVGRPCRRAAPEPGTRIASATSRRRCRPMPP